MMTGIGFLIAIFFKSAITQWSLESLYREVLVFWCFKSVRCMEFCLLESFQYRAFPAPYIAWTPRKFERREVSPHIWCLSCNILGQETPQHTCSWIYVFLSWYSFWKFWPEMRQKTLVPASWDPYKRRRNTKYIQLATATRWRIT